MQKNDFINEWKGVTDEFIIDVKYTYEQIKSRAKIEVDNRIKESGEENVNKVSIYANKIIDYMGLCDRTVIDYVNLLYIVSYILSEEYEEFNGWERPSHYDDM